MKPSLLLVGSCGLLGSSWAKYARSAYEITGLFHNRNHAIAGVDYRRIDLRDANEISSIMSATCAQVVVNCAGATNVDECEANPEYAYQSNVVIAENFAVSCAERRVKLIHISTDHIFSGTKSMSSETDVIKPLNVYAKTKALGEERVIQACPTALIIRTNFFGWGPYYRRSFSDVILDKLRASRPIELFTDTFFTPILMDVLFENTHKLLERNKCGIFNVAGDERVSKFDFGIALAKVFNLDEALVKPVLITDRRDLTVRPLDLSLDSAKLRSTLGISQSSLLSQLMRLKQMEVIRVDSEVRSPT